MENQNNTPETQEEPTEVVEENPTTGEEPSEDFSTTEQNIEDIKHFLEDSHIDYSEDIQKVVEVLEVNETQNEEIKGLLSDIQKDVSDWKDSETTSEVVVVDHSEVLSKIESNSNGTYEWLAGGIAIAISILIIYFLYKLIVPFTR